MIEDILRASHNYTKDPFTAALKTMELNLTGQIADALKTSSTKAATGPDGDALRFSFRSVLGK